MTRDDRLDQRAVILTEDRRIRTTAEQDSQSRAGIW